MISISNDFKNAMREPFPELQAYIKIDDEINITSADDLISFKITCETELCKTAKRKLSVEYYGEHNLLGKWIHIGFGVKLPNNTFEYLDYGSFLVSEITYTKDTGVTKIVAHDKMILSMVEYTKININYPIDLYNYTKILCDQCGLELGNETFTNADWQIDKELWENIDGITYRDIFVQIAQATGSTCIIGADDKLYFKYLTDTKEQLTYDNLMKLKLEPIYGEINHVILGRDPVVGEDVFLKDDESITLNGLTEFRIDNNEIVDKNREDAIEPIYEMLHGISYYPFEATTEGFGWYEIGDMFEIVNDNAETFKTVLFNFSITVDGGLTEVLKATANTKTQSQYQYSSPMGKRIRNTEILVNKQEQYIEQLVSDMYEEDGVINENFTNLFLNIENIVNSVQNSGGSNLIKNSVMFAYDTNGVPENWTLSEDGQLIIMSNPEAYNNGSISGHTFTLLNKSVSQRIYVKADSDDIEQKTYYTFSCKIKKNIVGTCYVKLSNSVEEHIIKLDSGQESFYGDYELKALLPKESYYDIEFYGSFDSNATFTDVMFALGQYKTTWTQANGEIMNTQVVINQNGALVKSSVYEGDYTVMSPLEFAGYSKINGVVTKVFSLNKDTTEVKKLRVEDEIAMLPIKIVSIETGNVTGWALVKTGSEN